MPHDHYIPRVAFRNALRHLLLVVQNGCDGTATIYPDVTYTFDSDLGTGQLHIAGERTERVSARRYLPPWLHVRFDDPKRAAGQPRRRRISSSPSQATPSPSSTARAWRARPGSSSGAVARRVDLADDRVLGALEAALVETLGHVVLAAALRGEVLDDGGGVLVLAVGAGLCLVAYRLMMRIGRLPTERRILS